MTPIEKLDLRFMGDVTASLDIPNKYVPPTPLWYVWNAIDDNLTVRVRDELLRPSRRPPRK
jgi:hypothetical protein